MRVARLPRLVVCLAVPALLAAGCSGGGDAEAGEEAAPTTTTTEPEPVVEVTVGLGEVAVESAGPPVELPGRSPRRSGRRSTPTSRRPPWSP
ncbi:MAG: hypothetical protein M5U14_18510 [Acidimicrobiia bacterium]|nr:hypothetical protein [Acidimicrobiia bacterium]